MIEVIGSIALKMIIALAVVSAIGTTVYLMNKGVSGPKP